ncbi:MAG: kinase [Lysobacter sp.]|nr:kinase [Lysobacter sp.]
MVLDDALAHCARVYGIGGLQGTGKSTLSAQVADLAKTRGLHVEVLSIDDFYLDHDQRLQLARDVHPLLATRGPPGTHDLPLACSVIDALRDGGATQLPRFDKISDRRLPLTQWPRARAADLVILEGWFLKTPAERAPALVEPLNAVESDEDIEGVWRLHCNDALGRDYPALWQRIDRLLWLQGPGFEVVPEWRWQQEVTLQAANPDRIAMTRPQVDRFVQFFERVSRQALQTLPHIAERTIQIDADRRPIAI